MSVDATKIFYRGAASLTNTVLYQANLGEYPVVTNIAVTNTTASVATFTIKFDGVDFVTSATIAANSVGLFDIRQVLGPQSTISGSASTTSVKFHISGITVV